MKTDDVFPGYQIIQNIYSTQITSVYKAIDESTQSSVIIKNYKTDKAGKISLIRIKNEIKTLLELNSDFIIKIKSMIDSVDNISIVMEDTNGISLREYLKGKIMPLQEFFILSEQMCQSLNFIHQNKIIHRDIKLDNFLINPDQKMVKLTDFGSAFVEDHLNHTSSFFQTTFNYISPELSGRTNMKVDDRSDLYSLGVTFFEMLTGTVPFQADDEMDLIYKHLTNSPPMVNSINKELPEMVSLIINKLLMKSPSERYQSAMGLKFDLEKCKNEYLQKHIIQAFALGQNDFSKDLKISEKFYGRETELKKLYDSFDNIANGSPLEVVFVGGHPGVGKTRLITELQKPLLKQKGYIITGKYEIYKRDQPFFAISQALNNLISQIMKEDNQKVLTWKSIFEKALNNQGGVLIPLISNLESLIGPQLTPIELKPVEAEKRLYDTFIRLFSAIAIKDHPIVLFLDDLQWADFASFKLLNLLLVNKRLQYFLFLGSYRDTEITDDHPLMALKMDLKNQQVQTQDLVLNTLEKNEIQQLIEDTFNAKNLDIQELTDFVGSKSNGNPLFVSEILKVLYENKAIYIDSNFKWNWDIIRIKATSLPPNLVDLLCEKINDLPNNNIDILKLAACIGTRFSINLLESILNQKADFIFQVLSPSINAGFILEVGEEYKFQHDRILEAIHKLIDSDLKVKIHRQIGMALLLLTKNDLNKRNEQIIEIVNHLNQSQSESSKYIDKFELADLNFQAATKASQSFVFREAINKIETALKLLEPTQWENQREKTFLLYKNLARFNLNLGEFNECEKILDFVAPYLKTELETGEMDLIKVTVLYVRGKNSEAISTGLEALKKLGIVIKEKPNPINLLLDFLAAERKLKKLTIEDLLKLPKLTDPKLVLICKFITELIAAAYLIGNKVIAPLSLKATNIYLQNGVNEDTPISLSMVALMTLLVKKDYELMYKYYKLSLELNETLKSPYTLAKNYYTFVIIAKIWVESARTIRSDLIQCFTFSQAAGERLVSAYATNSGLDLIITYSNTIEDLKTHLERYDEFISQFNHEYFSLRQQFFKNTVSKLLGQPTTDLIYNGQTFTKMEVVQRQIAVGNVSFIGGFVIYDNLVLALFDRYDEIDQFEFVTDDAPRKMSGALNFGFYLTSALYLVGKSHQDSQFVTWQKIRQLKKICNWFHDRAKINHENFGSFYELLKAEIERLEGNNENAENLYDVAISLGRKYNWPFFVGLASYWAALHYKNRNRTRIAKLYIEDSLKVYKKWGATGLVLFLENKFSDLIDYKSHSELSLKSSSVSALDSRRISQSDNSNSFDSQLVDFKYLLKASQALSQERMLVNIVTKLMQILVESAGAQRSMLILNTQNTKSKTDLTILDTGSIRWTVEGIAEAINNEMHYTTMPNILLTESDRVPQSLILYCIRTKTFVAIDNAQDENAFSEEKYFKLNNTVSVLSIPIMNKGNVCGVIYFENNLMSNAFTEKQIQTLTFIASQAAVSIENAILYKNMEELVKEQTQEIKSILEQVKQGIFTFGETLRINEDHSKYLFEIFKCENIKYLNVFDLLFFQSDLSEETVAQIKSAIELIIGDDILNFNFNSLILPKEITYKNGQQILEVDWLPMLNEGEKVQKLMVCIRDVTQVRIANERAAEHQRELELIDQLISMGAERFFKYIEASSQLVNKCEEIILATDSQTNSFDPKASVEALLDATKLIFHCLHTLKGNSRIYKFSELTQKVHNVEDFYSEFQKKPNPLVWNAIVQVEEVRSIEKYLLRIRNIAEVKLNFKKNHEGIFWNQLSLLLNQYSVDQLKEMAQKNSLESLSNMLQPLIDNLEQLANKVDKPIPEFILVGEEIKLDPSIAQNLESVFNHLFTNSVDHGLEKNKKGQLSIEASEDASRYKFEYSDSGVGLDLLSLSQKGLSNGSINDSATEEEIANLIFLSGISTSKNISDISGRGAGMSAVKSIIEDMGGTIELRFTSEVKVNNHRKFKFVIVIPKDQSSANKAA